LPSGSEGLERRLGANEDGVPDLDGSRRGRAKLLPSRQYKNAPRAPETGFMISIDQLVKLAGNLPLDKLSQYLPLEKIAQALPLDKLTGNAAGKIDEMKNRQRMSSVDTAWLRMDTPTNLMMIVGVLMFEGGIDLARFKRTVKKRLLRYPRFRQRVIQDPSGAYWLDDAHFDIDNHVHAVNLPAPGGKEALEQYVATLTTQSLDAYKPLWQMTVVQNYTDSGAGGLDSVTGSAVIVRIHHCIADGIALIGVMFSLTDTEPDAAEEGIEPEALKRARERRKAKKDAASERDFMASLFEPLTAATQKAMAMSGGMWSKSVDMASSPDKYAEKFSGYARIAADVTAEIAALATLPPDSATSFKGSPSAIKRVAWSAPLPLADVKAVCKLLGVSVNDVLLASVAGAMRVYLDQRGEADAKTEVRGFVPVNLRPRGDEHKLGNHFGLVALTLPVGVEEPLARVAEVKKRMDELKSSYQAALSMGILGVVGFLPRQLQKQVLDMFSSKGSAVMTNVPGPQVPLYLAGRLLKQQMFWVPQSGDIGMGVSILSYNGQVQFGLVTDRKFVPEPALIVDRFAGEFEKLVMAMLVEGQVPELQSIDVAALKKAAAAQAAQAAQIRAKGKASSRVTKTPAKKAVAKKAATEKAVAVAKKTTAKAMAKASVKTKAAAQATRKKAGPKVSANKTSAKSVARKTTPAKRAAPAKAPVQEAPAAPVMRKRGLLSRARGL
jgi:WS/DGAT/MGAT family acyltransferase